MTLTRHQHQAIHDDGNLLVQAAAGAGKTGTLVQRCLRLLLRAENPVSVRQILVVTFTEAAAAELRERLRSRLEEAANAEPLNEEIQRQLAGLDSAFISTLHSFCFQVIRRNVLPLGLDPAIKVLEPYESKIQFQNTFDLLLREHYAGEHDFSEELKAVIREQFGGWAKPLRDFVERVHEFTQTRPDPDRWFGLASAELTRTDCARWHEWFREAVQNFRDWWRSYLEKLPADNLNAQACAAILASDSLEGPAVLQQVLARNSDEFWTKNRKGEQQKPCEKFFQEAAFLASLLPAGDAVHPLDEDWQWMRAPLLTMIKFARQFSERFTEEKEMRGVLDFHDLEQLTLRLLVDPATHQPTELAREWQEKFAAVFVDEYQDINAAQDLILSALGAPEPGNRFLVGDAKQSIYRFRQADPSIFQQYQGREGWTTVQLSENFRSHEAILGFINPLFQWLMRPVFGGLSYSEEVALKFGNPAERAPMRAGKGEAPQVELHIFLTDQEPENFDFEENEPEVEETEKEARLVAARLRELKESGFEIYHQKEKQRRKVEWKDMVVLLRAAKNKHETYAKAFAAAGVPLQTKRNAFFSTQEVLDLCNVLSILDNPLQDIPLVGVLRSPLVGLSADELALVRIHSTPAGSVSFWEALNHVFNRKVSQVPRAKIERFLTLFHGWRDPKRCASLAQRIEAILVDTGYGDWLLAQPRGRERHANVQQLVRIARQFDEARGESLYLFLQHLEELQNAAGDIEPAGCVEDNAVRLMTVHQSKGLEFPVVAVADLGKQFNTADQVESFKLHDLFGLCAMVKPPHTGQRYPSLPLWLARRADRLEAIGEEIRVLYVALTRAQNHLLLFGSTTEKQLVAWEKRALSDPHPQRFLQLRSWLAWLATFTSLQIPGWSQQQTGGSAHCSFELHHQPPVFSAVAAESRPLPDLASLSLDFGYSHEAATRQSAKTSVTALRQKAQEDEEAVRLPMAVRFRKERNGTERGLATHVFLENVALEAVSSMSSLRAEAERLIEEGFLLREQLPGIDLEAVGAFWSSATGRELMQHCAEVKRELPFTFRATGADLAGAQLSKVLPIPEGEFVVIQGVADLVRIAPHEIWLLDFKTDRLERSALKDAVARYTPQLSLYAAALSAIYSRPVTRQGIYFLSLREFAWCGPAKARPKVSPQLELQF